MSDAHTRMPTELPGLDARCSRTRSVTDTRHGTTHEWHYLDTGDELERLGADVVGTILAVHGNPTWSYLWRTLVTASLTAAENGAPAWRVIAVDQLTMGYSARTGGHRRLAQRVADLGDFTESLALDGPVVSLGHDWGGVISLGWAIDHPELLAGVMLLNTAVHHPAGVPIPSPLRVAGARGVLATSTVATPAFLETTLALAHPALEGDVKDAFRAPYHSAARRQGIGDFVADIPVDASHPSFGELQRIASGVADLTVPALLLWGPADPIFGDRYLDDLIDRLPHADVHRFEGAGHLLAEDRPYEEAVLTWLGNGLGQTSAENTEPPESPDTDTAQAFSPLWAALDSRRTDDEDAIIDMAVRGGGERHVSWRHLDDRVRKLAAGFAQVGIRKGQRVSVLVPPGPTLTAVVYACLRMGAVVVVADAGLGVRGLSRAVRGAWPDVIIGESKGLAAARALGWPGMRISVARLPKATAALLTVSHNLSGILALGTDAPLPEEPQPDDPAAILFTSGSTGPAKGVCYTHRQLSALRDILAAHFAVTRETGLVTGFAPFALLGPALGTRSATPDMDVSSPRTLTARAVAAAVRASDAEMVFLSPAAVLNVVDTAEALSADDRDVLARVRTFLSTGAPVGEPLLAAIATLMPNAEPHTPYGMTECLLVTDVTLGGIRSAARAADHGVCVGRPIGANRVLISALDADGRAVGVPGAEPGVMGEIVVSASHLKAHYDRLWLTDRAATLNTSLGGRWHRTGDVGHLDAEGRLWVEGRLPHVLVTAEGPVAPVGAEQEIEGVEQVRRAAVVGVGPHGLRQAVAVVETIPSVARPGLATPELAAEVRRRTHLPLVAVLAVPQLPTDIRHNSKIDRTRLSTWAERTLAGGRIGRP